MSEQSSGRRDAKSADAKSGGAAQVTATIEEAQEVGYIGVKADPEPDENYTLQGQATRVPPPGQPGGPPADTSAQPQAQQAKS